MRIRASAARDGRLVQSLALAGVLAVALAARGGSAAPTPPAESAAASQPAASVESAPATPTITTVRVDRAAWFAGFKVTFGAATAEITPGRGGTVTIEADFENTGDEDASLDATLNLASAGENAREGLGMDIPAVPGGTTGRGVLAFDVDDTFTFDDAVLTLGRSTNQQAVVPLTAMAGEAITQEPVDLVATGSGTADDLQIDLLGGEYRAAQPWSHGQMEKGTFVLTLTYDATFESSFAGGFAFAGRTWRCGCRTAPPWA